MQRKYMSHDSEGERVCWVRLKGPTCNLFVIATREGAVALRVSDVIGLGFTRRCVIGSLIRFRDLSRAALALVCTRRVETRFLIRWRDFGDKVGLNRSR